MLGSLAWVPRYSSLGESSLALQEQNKKLCATDEEQASIGCSALFPTVHNGNRSFYIIDPWLSSPRPSRHTKLFHLT